MDATPDSALGPTGISIARVLGEWFIDAGEARRCWVNGSRNEHGARVSAAKCIVNEPSDRVKGFTAECTPPECIVNGRAERDTGCKARGNYTKWQPAVQAGK